MMEIRFLFRSKSSLLALLFLVFTGSITFGVQTHVITDSGYRRLAEGTLKNLSLGIQGELRPAPGIVSLAELEEVAVIWRVISDNNGGWWISTGNKGKLYHWTESGELEERFDPDSVIGRGLALSEDGILYYGTSPHGAIYRLRSGEKAEVFFDPGNVYFWDFLLGEANLWVAAGDPAQLWRVPLDGSEPEVWFSTQDSHLTRIIENPAGGFFLGSNGNGLVYEVTEKDTGRGIFQASEEEIRDLALSPQGELWIAAYSARDSGNASGADSGQDEGERVRAEFEAAMGLLPGSISSAESSGQQMNKPSGRGMLYRRNSEGFVFPVWQSRESGIGRIASFGENYWLLGMSDEGALYAVEDRDVWHKVLTLERGGEISDFAATDEDGTIVATSNPAGLYRLGGRGHAQGEYTSAVRDATQPVRWGNLEIIMDNAVPMSVEVRTGNTPEPDATWVDWAPVEGEGYHQRWTGGIEMPPSRFIQYKLTFPENGETASVHRVRVFVQLPNAAPVVTEMISVEMLLEPQKVISNGRVLDFEAAFQRSNLDKFTESPRERLQFHATKEGEARTFMWKASDPNGDELRYDVYLISESTGEPIILERDKADPFAVVMTSGLPDGFYRLRVVAEDFIDNSRGSGLSGQRTSNAFLVDHGAPQFVESKVSRDGGDLLVTFTVEDDWSLIRDVQIRINGGEVEYPKPEDQLFDSRREQFTYRIPNLADKETGIRITVMDEGGRETTSALNWRP